MSKEHPIEVRDMAIVHRLFRQAYDEAARLVRAGPTPSPERVTFLADQIDLVLGGCTAITKTKTSRLAIPRAMAACYAHP